MKVVFLGGKEIGYHCLDFLLTQREALDLDVLAVIASGRMLFEPDLSIEQLCNDRNVPMLGSLEEYLELPDIDLLISVQYHEILKPVHIDKARLAVNLHMAPLPEYRGCNQFSFAIVDGAKTFGTTLHRLEPGIDSGAILFERRFPVPDDVLVTELYQLTFEHSLEMFKTHLSDLVSGNFTPTPQADLVAGRGTSFHLRSEMNDLKIIDMGWPGAKIDRYVRATYFPPFEPPYHIRDGKKVYLSPDRLKGE